MGLGPIKNGKQMPITPWQGSWADQQNKPTMPSVTDDEFFRMGTVDQCRILRWLDNSASNCEGKTAREADEKRKPYQKRYYELQAIKLKQHLRWIEGGEYYGTD